MSTHKVGNTKMIGQQEEAWIDGYIFSNIEKRYIKALKDKDDNFQVEVDIPKSWFGLQATISKDITLDNTSIDRYLSEIKDMTSVLCKKWKISSLGMYPNMQYMRVYVIMERAIPRLTKRQIEKLLGYEIEIIQEN